MSDDLITKVKNEVTFEQKHRDGIPQLVVGLYMIISGLFLIADSGSFVAVYIVFIPILIEQFRKRYTYPRIGYAKLKEKNFRRSGMMFFTLALLIAGAIAFIIVKNVHMEPKVWVKLHYAIMLVIGLLVLMLMLYRYLREKNKTMLFYGGFIILLMAAIITFKLHLEFVYWAMLVFGILNLIYGIVVLRSFMKEYPVLENEDK
jgi:uncharacterized membrane protein HdeD (DUF308 family)